ncbi:hypothetical protein AB6735_27740 [Mucilaginibacter sp. RCC_168]|jgi:hypothetical protein|uniref:hypothetical protein n=1 Tax=Mucilaginibacter sp. RCC_168 TaxID=3239221 RepID=UPI0035234E5C
MKFIWLFILMIGGVTQLRAQQLAVPLPGKKPYNSVYPYSKGLFDNNTITLTPAKPNLIQPLTSVPPANNIFAAEMNDHMPVVKLQSADKMPVVKTDEPNMHYTMLIKRLGEAKTDSVVKTIRP